MPVSPPDAIVITGPTGAGKSEIAVDVARRLSGAIISADSRQIYRHMDIGTAKPPAELRGRVPHYGLDTLAPDEAYSAGRFARDAWSWIAAIRGRGGVPIVAGGSGFFLRALLAPLGAEPRLDPEHRAALRRYLSGLAVAELQRWLQRLDPARARQLQAEGGRQRLARSLEVVLASGRAHSWWFSRPPASSPLAACVFCLTLPRGELYERIDARFARMMADGLLDEVRRLVDRFGAGAPGLRSVGYAELVSHLAGRCTLEEAVEAAKRGSRRYARRQLTWFRHQLPGAAVWLDARRPRGELVAEVIRRWAESGGPLARGGVER